MRRPGAARGAAPPGIAEAREDHAPLFALGLADGCMIAMADATAGSHPIPLQGRTFRLLSRVSVPTTHREWRDTVAIAPQERVEIAFVADNPGGWMFHSHVLEHQAAGMMGVIRVGSDRNDPARERRRAVRLAQPSLRAATPSAGAGRRRRRDARGAARP